ncbi:hypothetical protein [Pasteurella bettyae]|uniref:Putative lipoprotein n=1 Tax=Pasteurella bettyae CCUG 2042 TaxID=1095749 RepID=I3DDG9_9PAST|nr:hypothetical protein [Pasteurella bettyae]EIJ69762.1 putative lipoprotein [Pasteurella bettyae CCUG 2042]SUB22002.1 Uncharacterised protein [Pasteurella bettyae]
MKKLILLSVVFMISACANDWSSSGVPDMYEGQSQESVLKALQKNNWVIKKQMTDERGDLYLIAEGKSTKQFQNIFGASCRQGKFAIYKKEGLQVLDTSGCENSEK